MTGMSDEELAARVAMFDQQKASAMDLAAMLATQYRVYRDVGIPADDAVTLVHTYLEAVLGQATFVEDE